MSTSSLGLVGWLRRVILGGPSLDEAVWSSTGGAVSQQMTDATAMGISTVYACVRLLADAVAGLPIIVYRRTGHDGRERAVGHPLYDLLHGQPNDHMSMFDFVHRMMTNALLCGVAYAEIKSGPRGWADQLIPLHPTNVIKELLDNGRYKYTITTATGQWVLPQERVFELGGVSLDNGESWLSVIQAAKRSLQLAIDAERYGANFFHNDSRPGGILRTNNTITDKVALQIKENWEQLHRRNNQHRIAVLGYGMEWQPVGLAPEEAQFIETRLMQAEDVCRWFGVPAHMVGLTSKSTSWGSGIEQMSIGFVTYTLRPWLIRWEQAVQQYLITDEGYFAEFLTEALMRGDTTARFAAYNTGRNGGWLSVNEIRRAENMEPIAGGDVYLQPLNMAPAGDKGGSSGAAMLHYRQLAEESAARLVRRELATLGKLYERHGQDRVAWAKAVINFYHDHAELVASSLRMSIAQATTYCNEGASRLLTIQPDETSAELTSWATERVVSLAKLAIVETTEETDDGQQN